MDAIWLEELPKKCPPDPASPFNGSLYRLVDNVPPQIRDFMSNKALFPNKVFKVDDCIQRACSVYNSVDECKKQMKYPRLKSKKLIKIDFKEHFGLVMNTFTCAHYSWWIRKTFNPSMCEFEVIHD